MLDGAPWCRGEDAHRNGGRRRYVATVLVHRRLRLHRHQRHRRRRHLFVKDGTQQLKDATDVTGSTNVQQSMHTVALQAGLTYIAVIIVQTRKSQTLTLTDHRSTTCWYIAKPFDELLSNHENYTFTWLRLGSEPTDEQLDDILDQIRAHARGSRASFSYLVTYNTTQLHEHRASCGGICVALCVRPGAWWSNGLGSWTCDSTGRGLQSRPLHFYI